MPAPPPTTISIASGATSPFALLTLIAAPAVLTNASSVLALGTSNRFARAVDRARQLCQLLEAPGQNPELEPRRLRQLERAERRSILLLDALMAFYTSLGSFASASLLSLIGAAVSMLPSHPLYHVLIGVALTAGIVGVVGIVFGCALLVKDTRLAVQNLKDEAANVRLDLDHRRQSRADDDETPA